MSWRVIVSSHAQSQLDAIRDQRIKAGIVKTIARLRDDPEKQGKALRDDLAGLRSVRAVGQRYRILYELHEDQVLVFVVALGIRREGSRDDVYEQAERDASSGRLERNSMPPNRKE